MNPHELKVFFNSVRSKHFAYRAALRRECEIRVSISGANTKHFSDLPPLERCGNGTENKYLRLLSFSEKTGRARREMLSAVADAAVLIAVLDDPAEYRVMKFRYIDFMKWDEISRAMNYSERQVRRINSRAIIHIAEKMSVSGS